MHTMVRFLGDGAFVAFCVRDVRRRRRRHPRGENRRAKVTLPLLYFLLTRYLRK